MSADVPSTSSEEQPARPFLTIVDGNPTDEELAALVGVFAAAGGGAGDNGPQTRDDWGRPVDMFRQTWGQPGSFTNRGSW
ncbi:acyl-CoA carboxylase subunit epsilon [Gordonia sp. (in: high G+C Gram-positive bacteria)]|uniref:acyl-CoA carboxylase subunit epsilon n=1 Tax=Gordonia sp. (in: high G+C Gram-positive bacteria) TaxID=84139 RepID=UPI0016AEE8CB|nr:acyl-CoA carboxylase subunit epsilon [Gordonia sp. (in: high G+C Gram-positive bacteria)]NLG46740.1 acyl-CoA carboxylase subunit epsilon [Gordonia sp. (in: high G+C Gram-positive bacteria)]